MELGATPTSLDNTPCQQLPAKEKDDDQEVEQEEPGIVMDPILANLHEDLFSNPKPTKFGTKTGLQRAQPTIDPLETVDWKRLIEEQRNDLSLWEHWTTAKEDDSNFVVKEGVLHHRSTDSLGETILQIVIPTDLRRRVFNLAHGTSLSGHPGKTRTAAKILQHFYWVSINKDVAQWCIQCPECQKGNRSRKPKAPLLPLPVVSEPFRRVAMDIVGSLRRTENRNKYNNLTYMDFATVMYGRTH